MDEKEAASSTGNKRPARSRIVVLAKVKRHANRARAEQISGQMGLAFEMPFDAARRIAREQNLRVQGNYLVWLASGKAPAEMPPNPDLTYSAEWLGWVDFLRAPKPVKVHVKRDRSTKAKQDSAKKTAKPARTPRQTKPKKAAAEPKNNAPRPDHRPLVEVARHDWVDGEWRRGKHYERVLPQWGKNLCRVLARRVLPHETAFFAVTWSADDTLYYAFRRSDNPREWCGIEYEAGHEVSQTAFLIVSHSPDEYDEQDDSVEGGNPDTLPKKRPRRGRAGGVIGILKVGRPYRKNPDNPRWKPKT